MLVDILLRQAMMNQQFSWTEPRSGSNDLSCWSEVLRSVEGGKNLAVLLGIQRNLSGRSCQDNMRLNHV